MPGCCDTQDHVTPRLSHDDTGIAPDTYSGSKPKRLKTQPNLHPAPYNTSRKETPMIYPSLGKTVPPWKFGVCGQSNASPESTHPQQQSITSFHFFLTIKPLNISKLFPSGCNNFSLPASLPLSTTALKSPDESTPTIVAFTLLSSPKTTDCPLQKQKDQSVRRRFWTKTESGLQISLYLCNQTR